MSREEAASSVAGMLARDMLRTTGRALVCLETNPLYDAPSDIA